MSMSNSRRSQASLGKMPNTQTRKEPTISFMSILKHGEEKNGQFERRQAIGRAEDVSTSAFSRFSDPWTLRNHGAKILNPRIKSTSGGRG